MKITSTKQAKKTLKPGMIANIGTDEVKVLELKENEVHCIDVEYDDENGDYLERGSSYYLTYTDFVNNQVY